MAEGKAEGKGILLENINQEQRARKENWNRYIKSNIPWSPGSRNRCLVRAWRGASEQKAPEMKKRLAVAVCLEKNFVFVCVLSTCGYSMYLGRKTNSHPYVCIDLMLM